MTRWTRWSSGMRARDASDGRRPVQLAGGGTSMRNAGLTHHDANALGLKCALQRAARFAR